MTSDVLVMVIFAKAESPSGGSSSGGSSTGGSPSTTTTTTRNPDGSTTTTTKDNRTGTVTETTKNPDGSKTVVETEKDGTVTTTETDGKGNQTETVTEPDGSSVTNVARQDGTTAAVTSSASGRVEAEVKLSAAAVEAAQQSGEAVSLPIPEVQAARDGAAAPTVSVDTGSSQPTQVEIPVDEPTPGTVAVVVHADGSEEVIRTSVPTEDGLMVALDDGATVKIVDNSKDFEDVPETYWAQDAIDFVSARELFSGTGEGIFSPEIPMTRAMVMTVLARLDGQDLSGGTVWYEKGMAWAVENGVSDGTAPESRVTREQLVTMLWRYAGSPAASEPLPDFPDAGSVSAYAQEPMRWAVENGIIVGSDGQLAPQAPASRAQVAQILESYIV